MKFEAVITKIGNSYWVKIPKKKMDKKGFIERELIEVTI